MGQVSTMLEEKLPKCVIFMKMSKQTQSEALLGIIKSSTDFPDT